MVVFELTTFVDSKALVADLAEQLYFLLKYVFWSSRRDKEFESKCGYEYCYVSRKGKFFLLSESLMKLAKQ